jgi:hypothetical protein
MQWVDGLALGHPHRQIFLGPSPQEGEAALIVPNALTAAAFVHAKGFASARVKHYLNDVGPITAANALELFLGLFAGQLASTRKVHVMLLMGSQ